MVDDCPITKLVTTVGISQGNRSLAICAAPPCSCHSEAQPRSRGLLPAGDHDCFQADTQSSQGPAFTVGTSFPKETEAMRAGTAIREPPRILLPACRVVSTVKRASGPSRHPSFFLLPITGYFSCHQIPFSAYEQKCFRRPTPSVGAVERKPGATEARPHPGAESAVGTRRGLGAQVGTRSRSRRPPRPQGDASSHVTGRCV